MEYTKVIQATAVAVLYLIECRVLGSETIPEGVVWTQSQAVFWEGQQMVNLPCRFQGEPLLVSWLKDDTAQELIQWSNGERSGKRFQDGSLDLTDDYSLVFKQSVKLEDTGRYFCLVHFNETQPINSSTVVTVREFQIQVAPRLTVWEGEIASLPCELPYTPFQVQWLNASSGGLVAAYTDGAFFPPSGGNGRFSLNTDFSLNTGELRVLDEATLTCKVFAFDTRSWYNSTELIVNAYGEGPSFDGCVESDYCSREVDSREFQFSCSVRGAKPDVNISLTAAGNSNVTLLATSFQRREDGTRDQTVNATVFMSLERTVEIISCMASGVAVRGTGRATLTVTMKSATRSTKQVIIITVVCTTIIGIVGLACIFCIASLCR